MTGGGIGIGSFSFDEGTDPRLRKEILMRHFAEVLTDRERARMYDLPDGCRMRERTKILAPQNLVCGHHVWIGEGAVLDAQGGLEIGDFTQIGLNVMVWSHTSHRQALESETCKSRKGISYKPTRIGRNCFIAGPSVIAPGVTIGDRVIVSPLTFVDRDIEDDGVVGGNREHRDLGERVERLTEAVRSMATTLSGGGPDVQKLEEMRRILRDL